MDIVTIIMRGPSASFPFPGPSGKLSPVFSDSESIRRILQLHGLFWGDRCDWQKALKPSLKPEQLEPIFPLPLPRGPDAGHGHAEQPETLGGEIEILCRERKRGVFQGPGSHLPLLPAWLIFNKGTGCQHSSPFNMYGWSFFSLSQQAKLRFTELQTASVNSRRATVGMETLVATCQSAVRSGSMFNTCSDIYPLITMRSKCHQATSAEQQLEDLLLKPRTSSCGRERLER